MFKALMLNTKNLWPVYIYLTVSLHVYTNITDAIACCKATCT